MIYYWWIQLISTCPHPPLQFGTSHDRRVPGTTSCCRSLSSKGVEWRAAEWWCHAGGPGQKGSVASLNHRLNPCKLYKHQPTGSSFLWLISSDLSRRFYLQCSGRKQVHLSPSPSTSSWNRKIGHNPSTEHRAPLAMSLIAFQWPTNINKVGPRCKLNFVTRLILNSIARVNQKTGKTWHLASIMTRGAQSKATERKKSMAKCGCGSSKCHVLGGGKFCKYKAAVALLRTRGKQPLEWRLFGLSTQFLVPDSASSVNEGRSSPNISAGCNKSKANSLCQSYAVMHVVKWLASSASQRVSLTKLKYER